MVHAGVVRRLFVGLVVLAAVVVVPVSGSLGASETQVDSIRLGPLDDGHSEIGAVLLKAGVRYHLVVTGYVTKTGRDSSLGSFADDAFYQFEDSQHPGPPSPPGLLFLGLRSEATGHVDFLTASAEDKRDRPPYASDHHYENHFTLKEDARLVVSAPSGLGNSNFTYGGPGFVVSVLSGGGPTPMPPGPKPGTCTGPTAASAHAAVYPHPWQFGGGRGYGEYSCFEDWLKAKQAVLQSPPLGKLEKVKVTIGGVTDADLVMVARYVADARHAPAGQLRANCLGSARVDIRALIFSHASRAEVQTGIQRSILDLVSCLAVAEEVDAYIASHPEAQKAQTPTCALTPFQVTLQSRRRRPTEVRVTGAPGSPNGPLTVTCVPSQGQIELTVQSRKPGVPLSRSLGPRLAIGIVRSQRDQPGGQVAVRFDRP